MERATTKTKKTVIIVWCSIFGALVHQLTSNWLLFWLRWLSLHGWTKLLFCLHSSAHSALFGSGCRLFIYLFFHVCVCAVLCEIDFSGNGSGWILCSTPGMPFNVCLCLLGAIQNSAYEISTKGDYVNYSVKITVALTECFVFIVDSASFRLPGCCSFLFSLFAKNVAKL